MSADDGNTVDYQALGAFTGSSSNPLQNVYLGSRSQGSWTTTPLDPAFPEPSVDFSPSGVEVEYISPRHPEQPVFKSDEPLAKGIQPTEVSLVLREPDTSYSLIATSRGISVLGASGDLRNMIVGKLSILYEWANGTLRPAGILPDHLEALSAGVRSIGDPMSADGTRIFFEAPAFNGQLYDRIAGMETAYVNATQRAESDPEGTKPARFWYATPDGSTVYFTSCEKLTNDATAYGKNENCHREDSELLPYEGTDLYRWHEDRQTHARELIDLSTTGSDPTGASVQGVLGISEDGSYVYFVAEGHLASGASPGRDNLYVWHEGEVRFITTLNPTDGVTWGEALNEAGARVTPDGRHLAFMSTAELTGYDNTDSTAGSRDTEVYEYSAASQELRCASCNPSGAPPTGGATLTTAAEPQGYLTRNLSTDGSRLFFESPDPLVAGASNGHMKVFEYENGVIYMLSSGTSTSDDRFGDASIDGNDVFIVTQSQLGAQDSDTLYDLYDARVGGVPAAPPTPASQCAGESCQGAPSAPPALSRRSTSENLAGTGNLTSSTPPVPQTNPKKLVKALHACRAKRNRHKRVRCEASARRRYGTAAKAKRAARRGL